MARKINKTSIEHRIKPRDLRTRLWNLRTHIEQVEALLDALPKDQVLKRELISSLHQAQVKFTQFHLLLVRKS